MTDYGANYWLDDCSDDLTRRPALAGDETVDVAILGGGFSGLWTAYFLLRADPGLSVAVIEQQFCGYGASGRNGGWCSPRYPMLVDELEKHFGTEAARATIRAQHAIIDDIGQIIAEEGIEAHFTPGGMLSVARTQRQMAGLNATYASYARLGLADDTRMLTADESCALIDVTGVIGAMKTEAGASIHPARLVRGLARAVERHGGCIYEGTTVTGVRPGRPALLETAGGVITARRAVVLAGGGMVGVEHLPPGFGDVPAKTVMEDDGGVHLDVGTTVNEAEKQLIIKTLESTMNNKTRAAEILGISTKTLQNKLKEYGRASSHE